MHTNPVATLHTPCHHLPHLFMFMLQFCGPSEAFHLRLWPLGGSSRSASSSKKQKTVLIMMSNTGVRQLLCDRQHHSCRACNCNKLRVKVASRLCNRHGVVPACYDGVVRVWSCLYLPAAWVCAANVRRHFGPQRSTTVAWQVTQQVDGFAKPCAFVTWFVWAALC